MVRPPYSAPLPFSAGFIRLILLYSLCALPLRLIFARRPRRPPAESGARREPAPRLACTAQHEFAPVQARRMCLIARARTPTTRKTPWPRGGPRCFARARLGRGRASRSIEDRLHYEICQAVSRQGLFGNSHCRTSPLASDAKQSQEANVPTRNSSLCWLCGRNLRTGNFCAIEVETRISGDISQRNDRYSIAPGDRGPLPLP